jgi:hypothetical protein
MAKFGELVVLQCRVGWKPNRAKKSSGQFGPAVAPIDANLSFR